MTARHVDVVIIGAGSAGERLATLLARDGRSVVVAERRLVGGECPYFACIPSKAMLISAAARSALSSAQDVGAAGHPIALTSGDEAWLRAVRRRDAAASHHDDGAHAQALRDAGAQLVRGDARITGPGRVVVRGDDEPVELTCDDLVLATGSAPVVPDLPGLRDASPWTYEEAWTTRRRPSSLLVVGGGPVGCEIAQTFARFGTVVTLVEQDHVGAGLEPEVAEDLAELLRADGVEVREGTALEWANRHDAGHVTVSVDGIEQDVDELVAATGMAPRLEGLGLDALGLDPEGGLDVDDHLRVVGADHVWAVGDVTDRAPFTHTANYAARVVADNLAGRDRVADLSAIPRAIYTRPEVAAVGLTRAQAAEAGIDVASVAFDLDDTARAAVDDEPAGHLVLVADRAAGVLVGASLIAPSAGEAISELTLAVKARIPIAVLADTVHPFPTWSEGFTAAIDELHRSG